MTILGDHKNHRNTKSFKKIFGFHRTLSTDAIHTGCKGLVRSKDWMDEAAIKTICHETGLNISLPKVYNKMT
jgi:hypothetical protein